MEDYYVDIATANYKDFLYNKLQNLRSEEGLPIELYELDCGVKYLVRCVYADLKKQEENRLIARIYNYYFASTLADIIFQTWEEAFIKKILEKEYGMSGKDAEELITRTWFNLNEKRDSYWPESRKRVLVKAILEFLDAHNKLDIEGFLNFRADLYKRELKKQIAQAVNDHILRQENEEFIRILRKFLFSQTPLYDTLHLVVNKDGEILFYDEDGQVLNDDLVEDSWAKLGIFEDCLISSLLKCAPSRLVIHANSWYHKDMLQIISEVFEDKISYCQGCSLCVLPN